MKNFKPITIFTALIVSAFAFYQCTNDEELFSGFPVQQAYETLQDVHDTLTYNDTVRLTITDPTIENILEGEQGIRLVFPPNSCTIAGGETPIAPYTVDLIEVFTREDMVSHNIQTFANDKALISGGMFWVRVKDANDVELTMTGVQAILPYKTDANGYENSMQYFVGVNQNAPSGQVLSWGTGNSELTFDESAGTNGEFTIWNIMGGWSNCDAFNEFTGQTPTQFTVKVSNVSDYANTKIFFALNESTTIAALTTPAVGGLKTYDNSIATGATGKIIAISLLDGELMFASQDVTIAGNDEFTLEVEPKTLEQLETLLASLD